LVLRSIRSGAPKDLAITVQHTWALILALTNNIPRDHSLIPAGKWLNATPLDTYIGGTTLGLVGLGKLGAGVARIATLAFGMKVIAWSPNLTQDRADEAAQNAGLEKGAWKAVSKDEVFAQSDILSVQIILSDTTRGLIKRVDLEKMKPSSFFINTSRGPIVDEGDLLGVLDEGKIRGAALDVFDIEPLPLDSRWRTTKWGEEGRSEVVMTPHSGYAFEKQMAGMWEETKANLQRLIKGEEVHNRMA
jgi:lactate dehydrogenase-like 2-hydroxyacid dehydrogenase